MIVFDVKSDVMQAIYNKPIRLNFYQRDRYATMYVQGRALFANGQEGNPLPDDCSPAEAALIDAQQVKLQMTMVLYQSASTVRRLVHKHKGCGPIAYFRELKIREAKRLLETTQLSVTQISEQLGFSTIHYFSRTFKNYTGMSLTEYLKIVSVKKEEAKVCLLRRYSLILEEIIRLNGGS